MPTFPGFLFHLYSFFHFAIAVIVRSSTFRRIVSFFLSLSFHILHSNVFIMSGKFVFFYFSQFSLSMLSVLCHRVVCVYVFLHFFLFVPPFSSYFLHIFNTTIILMHFLFNFPSCLRLLLFYQNYFCVCCCFFRFLSTFFLHLFKIFSAIYYSRVIKELFLYYFMYGLISFIYTATYMLYAHAT